MLVTPYVRQFLDADKGGPSGAAGTSDAENPVSPDAMDPENEAFLDALDLPDDIRAELKQPKKAEPQPKPAPKAEADEEDDDEAPLAENAPNAKMLKRINKLTAKRSAAEAERDALKAELAALKAKPSETPTAKPAQPAAQKDDVFAGVETMAQLQERVAQARETEAWVASIEARWETDGEGDIEVSDGNGGKTVLTPAQVRAYAKRADRIIRDRADAMERIAEREQSHAKAIARFPMLAKPEADRTPAEKQALAVAQGIRDKAPEFSRFPDSEYIIHLLAEAIVADQAKGTAATAEPKPKPQPIAPPPPLGVGGGGGSGKTRTAAASSNDDEEEAAAAQGADALAAYYASRK